MRAVFISVMREFATSKRIDFARPYKPKPINESEVFDE